MRCSVLQMTASDYSRMLKLLPALETLSQQHPELVVRDLASSVTAVIATHGAYRPDGFAAATRRDDSTSASGSSSSPDAPSVPTPTQSTASGLAANAARRISSSSSSSSYQPPTKAVSDWLLEACDPDVPTKAVALRSLTSLIQTRSPDAVEAQEKIFKVGHDFIHWNISVAIVISQSAILFKVLLSSITLLSLLLPEEHPTGSDCVV